MDVDVRDLELLDALGRYETLTAAARHLYVSQPALSQRLIRLEQRLATPLFDRRGRRLVANAAGDRMLRAAQIALGELRAAQSDVLEIVGSRRQPVRVATQCATTYQWLSGALRLLRERRPGAEVRIETVPDDETVTALLDARIDVALINKLDRQVDHVRLQRVFDDELRAVVASSHPWAGRTHVAAPDFVDVHLVLCESYDQNRVPPKPLPVPIGAQPQRVTMLPGGADLLIEMVASGGDVVTIMPSWIAAPYLESHDLTSVQVGTTPQARTWYCATRHGPQPESIEAFVSVLTEQTATPSPRLSGAPAPYSAPLAVSGN
jgi:LysR family transcriptional regulator, regulator for metE and metH